MDVESAVTRFHRARLYRNRRAFSTFRGNIMAKAPKNGLRLGGKDFPEGTQMPDRYRSLLEKSQRPGDPARGIGGAPPNFARHPIPHIATFSGMITTLSRAYRYSDEALRHSTENAHMMLTDPVVAGPLFARQMMVSLLNWSISSEDDKDPRLKQACTELTKIVERTPRFVEYRRNLLEAVWYGRTAIQHSYKIHVDRQGNRRRIMRDWVPISGDKLMFRYDDGSAKYDRDQIGVRVAPSIFKEDHIAGPRRLEASGEGLVYFFEPWERKQICLHRHFVRDGEYEDPRSGSQIHGVGLRHFIYWVWYQKSEALAQLAEMIDKSGMGFTVYYYPSGNEIARQEMEAVAQQQAHTNVVLIPHEYDNPDAYGIQQIPPNISGIEAMRELIENYFGDMITRFILGQTLSSKADATGIGSGTADLQKDSLFHIVRYDAINLEETITRELLQPLRDFNLPRYRNVDFFFRLSTKSAFPEKDLGAMMNAWQMGAKFKASDLFQKLDLAMPDQDDATLFNPDIVMRMEQMKDAEQNNVPLTNLVAGDVGPNEVPADSETPVEQGEVISDEPVEEAIDDYFPDDDAELIMPGQEGFEIPDEDDKYELQDSSSHGPVMNSKHDGKLKDAVAATDRSPSESQREAGNYRKGSFTWNGLKITIETPKGVRRRPEWPPMAASYGYINRHESDADGDAVDVFVGKDLDSEIVYCVDQTDAGGRWDEHKFLIGFTCTSDAKDAYKDSYTKSWKVGEITSLTLPQFKAWLDSGDTSRPLSDQVSQYSKPSTFTPPLSVQKAVRHGLVLKQKYGKGDDSSFGRIQGGSLSYSDVCDIAEFFGSSGDTGKESDESHISFLLHGGKYGKRWAAGIKQKYGTESLRKEGDTRTNRAGHEEVLKGGRWHLVHNPETSGEYTTGEHKGIVKDVEKGVGQQVHFDDAVTHEEAAEIKAEQPDAITVKDMIAEFPDEMSEAISGTPEQTMPAPDVPRDPSVPLSEQEIQNLTHEAGKLLPIDTKIGGFSYSGSTIWEPIGGGTPVPSRHIVENYPDDVQSAIDDVRNKKAGPKKARDFTPQEQSLVGNVSHKFGLDHIESKDQEISRRGILKFAKKAGFKGDDIEGDLSDKAVAAAQFMDKHTPHLESVVEFSSQYGYEPRHKDLSARSAAAADHVVREAVKTGYKMQDDPIANVAGAMEHLEQNAPSGDLSFDDILGKLFEMPDKISIGHVVGAVLGFWGAYSMAKKWKKRRSGGTTTRGTPVSGRRTGGRTHRTRGPGT